jgi:hypothetical protein
MDESGYKSTFDGCEYFAEALGEQGFWNFRDNIKTYGFLVSHELDKRPDLQALGWATLMNPDLVVAYVKRPKSNAGYGNPIDYLPIDIVDSRHIMMSTMVFSVLSKHHNHIVEIGGGYGNWFRLNSGVINFERWTIVDLPFVKKLQRWYLEQEKVDTKRLELVDTNDYWFWLNRENGKQIDIVIAAHSLSEVTLPDFMDYVDHVVARSRFLFYSTQKKLPTPELVEFKLAILDARFKRINTWITEGGIVENVLYEI